MRRPGTRRSAVVMALAAAAIVAALSGLTGCAGARNSLGTGASACFRALPAARDAIHDKGRLVGVRRVPAEMLHNALPPNATSSSLPDQELCVFAFNGAYAPGSVTGAQNTNSGRYAIVALGSKHPSVVAAWVLDDLPTRFRHLH
jgi:hypothetical protein